MTRKRKEDEMEVNWFAAETDYVNRGIILNVHLDFVGPIVECILKVVVSFQLNRKKTLKILSSLICVQKSLVSTLGIQHKNSIEIKL